MNSAVILQRSNTIQIGDKTFEIDTNGNVLLNEIPLERMKDIKWNNNENLIKNFAMFYGNFNSLQGIEKCTNLQSISLHYTALDDFNLFISFKKLKVLYLECCTIKSFNGIGTIRSLEKLTIYEINKIDSIPGFDELKHLTNLEELIIIQCNLNYLPNLDNLLKLKVVNFSVNTLTSIPNLPSNIIQLNIMANQICCTKNLRPLNKLESLVLAKNEICSLKDIFYNRSLVELYLQLNKIKTLKGIEVLDKLQVIDFSSNNLKTYQGIEKMPHLSSSRISTRETIDKFRDVRERIAAAMNLGEHILYLTIHGSNAFSKSDIDKLVSRINDKQDIINLGTKFESNHVRSILDYKFFLKEPQEVRLNKNRFLFLNIPGNPSLLSSFFHKDEKIDVFLVQLYSTAPENSFEQFCDTYWDISVPGTLQYNQEKEKSAKERITKILEEIKSKNSKQTIIVFPENTLPAGFEDSLKQYSKDMNAIIIGGIVHTLEEQDVYVNRAIIVDGDKIGYQVKQTPVDFPSRGFSEKIEAKIDTEFTIFETRYGRMALFICKDFLRFRNVICNWAIANMVEYIIVPALTSKILPFYARMIETFMFNRPWNFRVLFANIAQYGGSEMFTVQRCRKIEECFTSDISNLDNFGNKKDYIHRELPVTCQCEKRVNKGTYEQCVDCSRLFLKNL